MSSPPVIDCPVQRNNLLSEYTCSAGDFIFIDNQALTSQNPGPHHFTPQNTYVSTHLTFPCSGYIQTVEIQAQGDQDLQNVAVDLHLWRKQNSSTLPFEFQLMKRFPTTSFTTTVIMPRFFVLSANFSEEQFYFNEGDILGFEIPANLPINVTSSESQESDECPGVTYLLSANCCNCTPIDNRSVCDKPRIGIRIGEFAVYILKKCKRCSLTALLFLKNLFQAHHHPQLHSQYPHLHQVQLHLQAYLHSQCHPQCLHLQQVLQAGHK